MPTYDYRCHSCGRKASIYWPRFAGASEMSPSCPRCGSQDMSRLITRVAIMRGEDAIMEDMADPGNFSDLDEDDPRSVGRWMRKMSHATGEDLGPEFDEVVDRLEAGEDPEAIESSMPDLPGGNGTLSDEE